MTIKGIDLLLVMCQVLLDFPFFWSELIINPSKTNIKYYKSPPRIILKMSMFSSDRIVKTNKSVNPYNKRYYIQEHN